MSAPADPPPAASLRSAGPGLQLSVLDQSVAVAGRGEDEAIRDTVELAAHCEALGYRRFWVSEHHGLPTIVGSAPEIVMAAIAMRTRRIRIGSAGVMLPHYAALKVAEVFRVLEALAPGRIDLGVGRAPGGDSRTAFALNADAALAAERFPQQVLELQRWVAGERWQGVQVHPHGACTPEMWMLGSSDYGARLAARLGLPYAFAYFFMDGQGVEQALALYRSGYVPSPRHALPQATVCVWALVAESDDEARHHALSRERWRLDRQRGMPGALRAPDEVAARGYDAVEQAHVDAMRQRAFVGSAARVGAQLRALAEALSLDEIVVNTWAHDPAVRRRSYELLAREFALLAPL